MNVATDMNEAAQVKAADMVSEELWTVRKRISNATDRAKTCKMRPLKLVSAVILLLSIFANNHTAQEAMAKFNIEKVRTRVLGTHNNHVLTNRSRTSRSTSRRLYEKISW